VLVDKLGLDIPPAPEITLEEIFATEVRIAWNQAEFSNSIHKHIVEVNGIKGIWSKTQKESLTKIYSGGDEADGDYCIDPQPHPRHTLRYTSLHSERTWLSNP
jgi:hypothetical protein